MNYDSYNPEHRKFLAEKLQQKLIECGFKWENSDTYGFEKIYSISVRDTGIFVFVYTTIVGAEVRARGEDAIRVCGVYKHGVSTRGITKEKRINRVGEIDEIVQRMYERMRDVYRICNTIERCRFCGAPLFITKSNKKVCAAICWKNNN